MSPRTPPSGPGSAGCTDTVGKGCSNGCRVDSTSPRSGEGAGDGVSTTGIGGLDTMFAGRVGNPVAWRRFGMEGKTGMEGGGDALAMEGIAMDLLLVAGMTAFSALVRLSEYIGLGLGFGLVDTPHAVSAHSTDKSNSVAAPTWSLLGCRLRIVPPPHLFHLVINELVHL